MCLLRPRADASIDSEFSGTTCIIGLLRGRTLTVANIGDSRVILGRKEPGSAKLKAISVSDDHKPDREDEEKRIIARGGRVFAVEYDDGIDGPPRVWLGHMDIPGLAMSRSLGDTVAHTAGVISDPEMHVVELVESDKILIWASDGLWEFMSNQEVSRTSLQAARPLTGTCARRLAMDGPSACTRRCWTSFTALMTPRRRSTCLWQRRTPAG